MKRKRKKNVKKHDTHACTLHVIAAQKSYFYFFAEKWKKNADMKMDQEIKKLSEVNCISDQDSESDFLKHAMVICFLLTQIFICWQIYS